MWPEGCTWWRADPETSRLGAGLQDPRRRQYVGQWAKKQACISAIGRQRHPGTDQGGAVVRRTRQCPDLLTTRQLDGTIGMHPIVIVRGRRPGLRVRGRCAMMVSARGSRHVHRMAGRTRFGADAQADGGQRRSSSEEDGQDEADDPHWPAAHTPSVAPLWYGQLYFGSPRALTISALQSGCAGACPTMSPALNRRCRRP